MVFSYFNRLNAAQKRIYLKSDAIPSIALPNAGRISGLIPELESALADDDRARVEEACRKLAGGIAAELKATPVRIRVLAVRPHASWGELHGLYVPPDGRASAVITVWMRTAQRRRVVAFRSFLRTLLHELCHHLDYELLKLQESFHTQGFYKRESSLFHQLVPDARDEKATLP